VVGAVGLVAACLAPASATAARGVLTLTDNNFGTIRRSSPHLFVKFYAPWCKHSKNIAETWRELATDTDDVVVAEVDCVAETGLCSEHGVKGYPTLILFSGNADPVEHFGGRSVQALTHWLSEQRFAQKGQFREAAVPTPVGGLLKLNDNNYDTIIEQSTFTVVKFFAPWCTHCKRMAGAWLELAKMYEDSPEVQITEVDCTLSRDVCKAAGIKGYPTITAYSNGEEIASHSGSRDVEALIAFVEEWGPESGIDASSGAAVGDNNYADLDRGPDPVAKATDTLAVEDGNAPHVEAGAFETVIASGWTFVKFYAPWCGHCKALAPVWADLATEFEAERSVNVVRVDCDAEGTLCDAFNIQGYPTLSLFHNGALVAAYNGDRTVEALSNFVRDHANLHDEL